MRLIGVYKIEHVASGRFYVGHSINLYARLLAHRSLLRGSKHHCKHLQMAWSKYGEEAASGRSFWFAFDEKVAA